MENLFIHSVYFIKINFLRWKTMNAAKRNVFLPERIPRVTFPVKELVR